MATRMCSIAKLYKAKRAPIVDLVMDRIFPGEKAPELVILNGASQKKEKDHTHTLPARHEVHELEIRREGQRLSKTGSRNLPQER